ncbi:MAG: hypothetical protein AAGA76_01370 [Pseudomonadota bacterium]
MAVKRLSAGGLAKNQPIAGINRAAGKLAAFLVCIFLSLSNYAQAQNPQEWIAGRFTFSDELGGFRIINVSGTGTRDDPVIIRQVFDSAYSGTLVIRSAPTFRPRIHSDLGAPRGTIYMHLVTTNNTNLPWVGFGFELQEKLDKASTYSDGLSFDQLSRRRDDIYSDRFLDFEDQFEPGDRLVYTNGIVNNRTTVATRFVITDFTPVPIFYLYQDPLIPAS